MSIVFGRSVYETCETPSRRADFDMLVACPFKHGSPEDADLSLWCRSCLIAKIGAMREQFQAIANHAITASRNIN